MASTSRDSARSATPPGSSYWGSSRPTRCSGSTCTGLIHHTRPDGSPFPVEECPIYRTFQSGEGTLGEEDVFWRADGTPIPVEYRAHPIRRDGETLGAVVTFVDVAPSVGPRPR